MNPAARHTSVKISRQGFGFYLGSGDHAEVISVLFALNEPVDGPNLYIGAYVDLVTDSPTHIAVVVNDIEVPHSRTTMNPVMGCAHYNVKDLCVEVGNGFHRVSIVVYGPSVARPRNVRLTAGNGPDHA